MTPNLSAFLMVVRSCEGTLGDEGYKALFGWRPGNGKTFASFADHPRVKVPYGQTYTTAAGAYQMLSATYDDAKAHTGVTDFSPESQDKCAAYLIQRRGAWDDVQAGRLRAAISKCNKEWASLPGSPYGQPTRDLPYCERIFAANGGKQIDGNTMHREPRPDVPVGTPLPAVQKQPSRRIMDPLSLSLVGMAAKLVPDILKAFGGKEPSSSPNVALVQKVADVVVEATGASGPGDAMDKLPSKVEAVAEAVMSDPTLSMLVEASGGVGGARKSVADYIAGMEDDPFWRMFGKFVFSPINWVTGYILYQMDPFMRQLAVMFPTLSESVRATITASLTTLVIGAVCGYWLGMYVQKQKE